MAYYQHQQQPTTPLPGSSSTDSNIFGDMQSSEGRRLYTELTGVDVNTFSDTPSAYQSQTPSTSNAQQHNFRELEMDYNQNDAGYENSYGNTSTATSGPYATLRFPSAPMFPPIPMPSSSYPNATISPVDMTNTSISSNSATIQKPPRSSALSLNGLPIYSASGFDMLDILARVATRPQPKIAIGPVDMSCAFLVVDVTRDDSPIIYASHTFTELTGYNEQEILGRNCRFLQAPPGVQLAKGGAREHTDIDSVTQMAQNVSVNRECQVTLVNYRKSGEAFINCVSIIPVIPSGNEPVRYHVGFQVDLAIQPLAIMRSVQNGSYITNYSSTPLPPVAFQSNKLSVRGLSKNMIDVIGRIGGNVPSGGMANESQDRHRLSLALLEECPDAVFVVSLKGSFLYVSPSITRLLDYDADYFLNKNLADICHPSDLAPTMRNVKESTTSNASMSNAPALNPATPPTNDIELLFRARRSNGTYVWLDCPGKLHADTSRGRKALLLRLRKVDIPRITWGAINGSGGVYKDDVYLRVAKDGRGLVVACSKSVEEVFGRKRDEIVGKTLVEMIVDDVDGSKSDAIKSALGGGGLGGIDTICSASHTDASPTKVVYCNIPAMTTSKRHRKLKNKNGSTDAISPNGRVVVLASTELTFFPVLESVEKDDTIGSAWRSRLCTVIVRMRVIQRRPMRTELQVSNSASNPLYASAGPEKGSYGATSSGSSGYPSSGPGSSSYGLSTNEMPYNPLSQQMTSPMQLFRSESSGSNVVAVRKGYQVPMTGNVNAIDDSIPGEVPSPTSSGGYGEPLSAVGTGASIGSSWLYDLEQLRKRNQTLRAELVEVKRERSKHRPRHSASFGHHQQPQQQHNADHPLNMARLDALASASASGISAINASRFSGSQASAISTPWAVSFPGNNNMGSGNGSGDGGGNQPRLNLSMPPPPPRQMHGDESNQKRSWSQTDMHSEWHH